MRKPRKAPVDLSRLSGRARMAPVAALLLFAFFVVAVFSARSHPFPSDRTPEGAYLRIAKAIGEEHPEATFAYLETDAQWASYTIRDDRKKALAAIGEAFPAAERASLIAAYRPEADAKDGADVFVIEARRKGFLGRLRRDLSGVARVEVDGERASVVTARGTRYPFRRRDNGIWGLTIFTADLVAESERAARDLATVQASAEDYRRGAKR